MAIDLDPTHYSPVLGLTFGSQVGGQNGFSTGSGTPDRWVHLTGVFASGSWILYQDGDLLGSASGPFVPDDFANLTIGGSGFFEKFIGLLDDIRIYNRALTASEVSQLYLQEAGNLDSDGDGLTDAWERVYVS